MVDGFASTISAGGYGSLLSQGRRRNCGKFNTTGKSPLLVFRIRVKPQNQKYFASQFWKSEL